MEAISSYLIKDYDEYFDNLENFEEHQEQKVKNYLDFNLNQETKKRYSFDNTESCIIEHIEETNYLIKEQEQKYKIFDDISSVIKNKNDKIELVINIPKSSDIITINKIKLSKSIKDFIFDIFVTLDKQVILEQEDLYKKKINFSNFSDISDENNIIDCSKGEVNIHIILEPQSINKIINNNIYISFTYINYKNKIKFFLE